MQLIIEINHEPDLQLLLSLLERMQIVYKPISVPKKRATPKATNNGEPAVEPAQTPDEPVAALPETAVLKPSERLAGKLSSETAKALLAHIEQSRNEWERSF